MIRVRFSQAAVAVLVGLLVPNVAIAQQRMAPLPPPCSVGGVASTKPAPRPLRRPFSLAVLPLTVEAGAARFVFLSDGLPNAIATRIATSIPRLFVAGRHTQHKRAVDAAALRTIGADLGVEYVLAGTVGKSGSDIRVSFALYDAQTGRRNWVRSFVFDSAGVLPIEQATAIEVATRIVGQFTPAEQDRLLRVPTARHAAYESFLRGEAAAAEQARSLAADAYRHALQIDPRFADAYAKLAIADADVLDENDMSGPAESTRLATEVRVASRRATALDSTLSSGWLARARQLLYAGEPPASWSEAFQHALARDSTDPVILGAYGVALAQIKDYGRARPLLERAAVLDPNGAGLWTWLGEIAVSERRDADACRLLNRAIAEDALYAPAWALRALVRGRHDDLRFAWADAVTAERLGSMLLGESSAAQIDLIARDTVRARERLAILWQEVRDRKTVSVLEGRAVAVALLAAGEKAHALDVLESVRPLGPRYTASLRDSTFDRLRSEPRFRALVSTRAGP
jgi:TolB-like protein